MNRKMLALSLLLSLGANALGSKSAFAAAPSSCLSLVEDLKAMKKAQQAMIQSLAENHEGFATSLTEVATEAEMANGKLPGEVLRSMRSSAKAYRVRGEKAEKQGHKLNEATSDLIKEFESCLAAK